MAHVLHNWPFSRNWQLLSLAFHVRVLTSFPFSLCLSILSIPVFLCQTPRLNWLPPKRCLSMVAYPTHQASEPLGSLWNSVAFADVSKMSLPTSVIEIDPGNKPQMTQWGYTCNPRDQPQWISEQYSLKSVSPWVLCWSTLHMSGY